MTTPSPQSGSPGGLPHSPGPDYGPPPVSYPEYPANYPPPAYAPPPGPAYPAPGYPGYPNYQQPGQGYQQLEPGYPQPGPGYPPAYPGIPGGFAPYDPYRAAQPGTNGLAIGSLITSIMSIPLMLAVFLGPVVAIVGIVLGIAALNQIKQTGQTGRSMAVAGIIVGAVALTLVFGFAVVVGIGSLLSMT